MMGRLLRWFGWACAVVAAVTLVALPWAAFYWAPIEKEMGVVQKIFYLHMPIAVNSFHAFFFNFVASIMWLWRRRSPWDHLALASAEVGLLLATLTLVTGSLWARPIWNTWWNWEPRLTTMLLLWFLYLGYLVLRGSIEEVGRKRKFAAIWGLLAFADVPLVYFSVHWFERELHPVVVEPGGGIALAPRMIHVLMAGLIGVTALTLALILLRARLAALEEAGEPARS